MNVLFQLFYYPKKIINFKKITFLNIMMNMTPYTRSWPNKNLFYPVIYLIISPSVYIINQFCYKLLLIFS